MFWIQQRLPGHVLDPGTGRLAREAAAAVLPRLLKLNDARQDLGTGPDSWPGLIARTLASGGDGYRHLQLARLITADIPHRHTGP